MCTHTLPCVVVPDVGFMLRDSYFSSDVCIACYVKTSTSMGMIESGGFLCKTAL